MAVEIVIKSRFPYKGTLEDLAQFVDEAKKYGYTHFTWAGYSGNQRDPAQLTITAEKDRP